MQHNIPYRVGIIQPTNHSAGQDKSHPASAQGLWDISRRRTKKETGEILHRKTRFLLLTLKPVSLFFELKARPNSDLDATITC